MQSYKVFNEANSIPSDWDAINHNIFLSTRYLAALYQSVPSNVKLFLVAFYDHDIFVGKAFFQCISIYKTQTLGQEKNCLKKKAKNLVLKKLCGNVLFLGNNMLTGQHAFSFQESVSKVTQYQLLECAMNTLKVELEAMGTTIHLVSIKDFNLQNAEAINTKFVDYHLFSTQPSMVFEVRNHWNNFDDYIKDLSKKYRLQYNRARNKMTDVVKQKLSLDDIKLHENRIHELYLQVVENASFNTFILPKHHFYEMKKHLNDDLFFYGYFHNGELVGFSTLIKNGESMGTYFLGYDPPFQKSHLLYLNMLYDMIAFSINQKFKTVVFGRTAMEIKSSVGAKPIEIFGLIKHKSTILQNRMDRLFKYFDPQVSWIERHPFKDNI